MRGARLALGIAALVFAASAQADLKVYDSSKTNGLPGDLISLQSVSPFVQVLARRLEGHAFIEDGGSGSPTLSTLTIEQHAVTDLNADSFPRVIEIFGPGAFIFVETHSTMGHDAPHVGTGDSAPGGQITWGVISGWVGTSTYICLSSPAIICIGSSFGGASPPSPVVPSASYDLGTWSFDAEGDYEATSFIQRTTNGGMANTLFDLRGAFVGASLPALPLVGLGALAACLAVVGSRRVLR